jgi:hypothetical protein
LGDSWLTSTAGACVRACAQRGTLHVGDRFTSSGNDNAARSICSILWVANPDETAFFIKILLNDVHVNVLNHARAKERRQQLKDSEHAAKG